jgi:prepilin-type N-terminal cleavage/methylation domain-containing protein
LAKPIENLNSRRLDDRPVAHAAVCFAARGLRSKIQNPESKIARAFTLVELLVVVAIIGVILGIGLPAFNSMTAQARRSKTRQLLQGALTRASVLSVADRNLVAVRIFPGAWDQLSETAAATPSGAAGIGSQVIAMYKYVTRAERPLTTGGQNDPSVITYVDRFERIKESPAVILPPDVWIAPIEALITGPNGDRTQVDRNGNGGFDAGDTALDELAGAPGWFDLDCDPRTNQSKAMLNADDFLMVFDPEQGLVSSRARPVWKMFAYDPRPTSGINSSPTTGGLETGGDYAYNSFVGRGAYVVGSTFQRMNFTGAVIYDRKKFLSFSQNARTDFLAREGLSLYATGGSGTLIAGGQ